MPKGKRPTERPGKTTKSIEFTNAMIDAIHNAKPDDRGYQLLDLSKKVRWLLEDQLAHLATEVLPAVPAVEGRKRGRPAGSKNAPDGQESDTEGSGASQDGGEPIIPS